MLGLGTLLNLVFLFLTLMLYAQRADPLLAMAVHLAVLPLNFFWWLRCGVTTKPIRVSKQPLRCG